MCVTRIGWESERTPVKRKPLPVVNLLSWYTLLVEGYIYFQQKYRFTLQPCSALLYSALILLSTGPTTGTLDQWLWQKIELISTVNSAWLARGLVCSWKVCVFCLLFTINLPTSLLVFSFLPELYLFEK